MTADVGEAVMSAGLKHHTFGYLFFKYGFGAGVDVSTPMIPAKSGRAFKAALTVAPLMAYL